MVYNIAKPNVNSQMQELVSVSKLSWHYTTREFIIVALPVKKSNQHWTIDEINFSNFLCWI